MNITAARFDIDVALRRWYVDPYLLVPTMALLSLGLVMVASASFSFADYRFGNAFFLVKRHIFYVLLGCTAMASVFFVSANWWAKYSNLWIFMSFVLLVVVLLPGVGREVNGSRRWLAVGGMTLQVSELVKVAVTIYLARFFATNRNVLADDWRKVSGIMLAMLVLFALLLVEPDYGSVVVIGGIFMTLFFIGGASLGLYTSLVVAATTGLWFLAEAAQYRLARLVSFLDPWADPYGAGYQLTQSLIAFGRGEWWGLGLGQSVQKMHYLPEAHTDFLFAIFAEEFGFVGVVLAVLTFVGLIARIFQLSRRAMAQQQWYAAYLLAGFGVLISGQAFINIGVNAGLLPTKGLTLPFVSYGGSSLLACCMAMGLAMRLSHDLHDRSQHAERWRHA